MMTARPLKSITLKLSTAEEIISTSGGKVTIDAAYDDSGAPIIGGLFCPATFGAEGRGFGHIELAYPVVHPWYEEAARLLTGMDDLSDGQAVLDALRAADIDKWCEQAASDYEPPQGQEPGFAPRCAFAMRRSGVRPEAMVVRAVAVVPPVMRPLVRSASGATLSSDLNEHYRRVIARNNALNDLLAKSGGRAPGAYLADARERLASAVRSLLGDPAGEGALQSLTSLLTDRNGFLKRNLSGKRQDYSGRSVIVSGPDLDLRQCGLPYDMALEVFKPFIARRLVENSAARSSHQALEKIVLEPRGREVRRAVQQVAAEKLVLLNRAPTLHRLGIQPFEPVLVDHRAIALHPLVCYGFNADFDGDQMAVHVPISKSAQGEARALLDSAVNLASPANGAPVAGPVQDIILGIYYLTAPPAEAEPQEHSSARQLIEAVDAGDVHPHMPVVLQDGGFSGREPIRTTAGRVLFNSNLPRELRFTDSHAGKREVSELVARCLEVCGHARTREMLDDLNRLGFEYATRYAPSFGLGTVPPLEATERIRAAAREQESALRAELSEGRIDGQAFYDSVCRVWHDASSRASDAAIAGAGGGLNPFHSMPASGARGTFRNVGLWFGIGGPIWRPEVDGRSAFEAASESSYWEGMSPPEHFARAFGARKGLLDAYVRSNEAWRLTRELIYAAQGVTVTSTDCGTSDGIEVSRIEFGGRIIEPLARRIRGRVASEDVVSSSGGVMARAGELIPKALAAEIEAAGVERVKIRSALACADENGVCALCYGEDLAYGRLVAVGSAVGVVAAHAISEPAVQLTMQTYLVPGPMAKPGETGHPGGMVQMLDLFAGKAPELSPGEFIAALQSIFGWQGVEVDDKHFELVARRMYSFTRIEDPGDAAFLRGDIVPNDRLRSENSKVASSAGRPASGTSTVLGVHAAAQRSSSVIGSAAVNDSRRTLALAALAGARDELQGTLERIVVGLAPRVRTAG